MLSGIPRLLLFANILGVALVIMGCSRSKPAPQNSVVTTEAEVVEIWHEVLLREGRKLESLNTAGLIDRFDRLVDESALFQPGHAIDPGAADGRRLPEIFEHVGRLYPWETTNLWELFDITDRQALEDATVLVELLHLLQDRCPEEFVERLVTLGERLPPCSGDCIVYWKLTDMTMGFGPEFEDCGEEFWTSSRYAWRRLLESRNPVYRLLAIRSLDKFETDDERFVAASTRALEESNSVFQIFGVWNLKTRPSSEGLAALHAFLDRSDLEPNDGTVQWDGAFDIREYANAAIAEIEANVAQFNALGKPGTMEPLKNPSFLLVLVVVRKLKRLVRYSNP